MNFITTAVLTNNLKKKKVSILDTFEKKLLSLEKRSHRPNASVIISRLKILANKDS
ncbi:MAG: hypothetical protein PHV37_03035 [Candidatus Gastranaerophilales bacterium]|nr:hypothetical protein [Candidatus Gastranaerophilales bacterium]